MRVNRRSVKIIYTSQPSKTYWDLAYHKLATLRYAPLHLGYDPEDRRQI